MKRTILFCMTLLVAMCTWATIVQQGEREDVAWSFTDDGVLTIQPLHAGTLVSMPKFRLFEEPYFLYGVIKASQVNKIIIKEGIIAISNASFQGYYNLTSVSLPSTLQTIGSSAFSGCSRLYSISIPEGVTSIGDAAFYNCKILDLIDIPSTITSVGASAFENTNWLSRQDDTFLFVGHVAYKYLKPNSMASNATITLPEGTISITDGCFEGCTNLSRIILPHSLREIGDRAFKGCTRLDMVYFNEGLTHIQSEAFMDCTTLSGLYFPSSLLSVGYGAFDNTRWLDNQPEGLVYAGRVAYQYIGTVPSELELEPGTVNISGYAFLKSNSAENLTKLTLPISMKNIDDSALYGCFNLLTIVSNMIDPFSSPEFGLINGVVEVPYGTKQKYLDAGWTDQSSSPSRYLFGSVKETFTSPSMNKRIYVFGHGDKQVANKGRDVSLCVMVDSDENINAIYFSFAEPEGFSFVKGDASRYTFTGRHTIASSVTSFTRQVSINAYSPILAQNGLSLYYLTFSISEDLPSGMVQLHLSNCCLVTTSGTKAYLPDYTLDIKVVEKTMGDANSDEQVTITDALTVVYYVLGKDPGDLFNWTNADVNEDDDITITDALTIVKQVLGGSASAKARDAEEVIDPQ